jgi:hypothetical protein
VALASVRFGDLVALYGHHAAELIGGPSLLVKAPVPNVSRKLSPAMITNC